MESYFQTAHIPADEQATSCVVHLGGEAKLWMQTQITASTKISKALSLTCEELKETLQ